MKPSGALWLSATCKLLSAGGIPGAGAKIQEGPAMSPPNSRASSRMIRYTLPLNLGFAFW